MKFYDDSSSSTLIMEVTCGLKGYTFIHQASKLKVHVYSTKYNSLLHLYSNPNHMFTH